MTKTLLAAAVILAGLSCSCDQRLADAPDSLENRALSASLRIKAWAARNSSWTVTILNGSGKCVEDEERYDANELLEATHDKPGEPWTRASILVCKAVICGNNDSLIISIDDLGFTIGEWGPGSVEFDNKYLAYAIREMLDRAGMMNGYRGMIYKHVLDAGEGAPIRNIYDETPEVRDERMLEEDKEKQYSWVPDPNEMAELKQAGEFIGKGGKVDEPVKYKDSAGTAPLLYWAVEHGYCTLVKYLLYHGANPNYKCFAGGTPLHTAASRGNREAAVLLLLKGADVNARDDSDETPLMHAIINECFGTTTLVMTELLEAGAAVDAKSDKGRTALWFATENGIKYKTVELLINHGADVNAVDNEGITPLYSCGNERILNYLLSKGGKMDVYVASKWNRISELREMLKKNPELAKFRIVGASSGKITTTPLHAAAENNNVDAMKLLLENGADVNAVDAGDQTPLHRAALYGHAEAMKVLLDNGAKIDAKDHNSETALHYVAERGGTDSEMKMRLMLDNHANVNIKGPGGWTPLHMAAAQLKKNEVELLVKAGADVNAWTTDGYSPLDLALREERKASPERIGVSKYLIEHGAKRHRPVQK